MTGYLRPSIEDLEAHLLASRRVRDFLKIFSATQWPRVVKATMILGIQALEKERKQSENQAITQISVKDIEDLVGKDKSFQM